MATFKEHGVPGKNTKGIVGDAYYDLNTDDAYRCVSIFRDSMGTEEYEWKYDPTFTLKNDHPEHPDPVSVITGADKAEPERPRNDYRKPYAQYSKQNKK